MTDFEALERAFSQSRLPFAAELSTDMGDPVLTLYPSAKMEQADQCIAFFFHKSGKLWFVRAYKENGPDAVGRTHTMTSPLFKSPGDKRAWRCVYCRRVSTESLDAGPICIDGKEHVWVELTEPDPTPKGEPKP